ncbi:hypothetical protein LCGC14_1550530 [marine sediment metagenome]|uniref:Uncharacterized protein n=1 Tax=marine sediment metagenome TaxID=412755 RepID=A0A0F9LR70_9ZZZZ
MSGKKEKQRRRKAREADPTITRRRVVQIWNVLEAAVDVKAQDPRFVHGIAKNRSLLRSEAEAIQKAQEPPEAYQEYEKKRIELCKLYAVKDKENQPMTMGDGRRFLIPPEKRAEFDAKVKALQEEPENEKAIEEFREHEKKIEEFLDEEIPKLELHPIALGTLPPGVFSARDLEALGDMIRG